jgi:hypothetical protein
LENLPETLGFTSKKNGVSRVYVPLNQSHEGPAIGIPNRVLQHSQINLQFGLVYQFHPFSIIYLVWL